MTIDQSFLLRFRLVKFEKKFVKKYQINFSLYLFQAFYVQLVLLFVQYASLQYNYNYNGNYNNPGYYQNSMQNYGYGYPTSPSNNDLIEEETPERLSSIEILRSSKHRKRDKKKKNKKKKKKRSKSKVQHKDSKGCDSEYNSPECKSGDDETSTECRECTCPECVPNNSNQNSCCPISCEQCIATQPPGMAIMAYPIHFLMPPPMPMPIPYPITLGPNNCTSDSEDSLESTTDNTRTTESYTTDNSEETTHTTFDVPTVTEVPDTTDLTDVTEHSTRTSSTTIETTTLARLMASTSTSPIFVSTTRASTTATSTTTISTSTTSTPTELMERMRQPVHFEQYHHPYHADIRRPFSDHYYVSSNKREKIRPMYDVQNDSANDERDIRMIVVKDERNLFNYVTHPPNRMLMRSHRDYVDEMEFRNNFRARYDMRSPRYPTRRVSPHKIPKYGILPLPDKLASKLLLKLRSMKELNTNGKNIPQIRKLKQK